MLIINMFEYIPLWRQKSTNFKSRNNKNKQIFSEQDKNYLYLGFFR